MYISQVYTHHNFGVFDVVWEKNLEAAKIKTFTFQNYKIRSYYLIECETVIENDQYEDTPTMLTREKENSITAR